MLLSLLYFMFNSDALLAVTGFSLLECLLVITILSLCAAFGCYAWSSGYQRQQLQVAAHQVQTFLNFARDAARGIGQTLTVCGSTDGAHCDGVWNRTLLLTTTSPQPLQILRRWQLPLKDISLQWRGGLGQHAQFHFDASGALAGEQGSFYLNRCSSHSSSAAALEKCPGYRLIISSSGHIRMLRISGLAGFLLRDTNEDGDHLIE